MEFGILILLVFIAYYSYHNIFLSLHGWLGQKARLPDYLRDKYKQLQVGQIWTDNRRYCTIQWINKDRIRYSLYYHKSAIGSYRFEFNETADQFRKLIDGDYFHLTEEIPS